MDIKRIIIVLAIILIILVILNSINYIKLHSNDVSSSSQQGNCSQTVYGCCPDGVNSKINFYGTNCPSYLPPPGYPTNPN
jgi:hypothetical protein